MKEEYVELYENIIRDNYGKHHKDLVARKTKAIKSIEQFVDRIAKAKNLLLDNYIDYKEYVAIKTDLEAKINLLGTLIEIIPKSNSSLQIE